MYINIFKTTNRQTKQNKHTNFKQSKKKQNKTKQIKQTNKQKSKLKEGFISSWKNMLGKEKGVRDLSYGARFEENSQVLSCQQAEPST